MSEIGWRLALDGSVEAIREPSVMMSDWGNAADILITETGDSVDVTVGVTDDDGAVEATARLSRESAAALGQQLLDAAAADGGER
jgi:hypothetical protein